MSDTDTIYVTKELYEEREKKNQVITDRKLDEIYNEIALLKSHVDTRLNSLEAKMEILNARMDILDMKIDKVEATLSTAISGLMDRFEDMKEHQNKWFALFGILFAAASIITPVAVAIVQHYMK